MGKNSEIRFKVLGDSGPFSRAGKSIGYMVSLGGKDFLVDCGSPLFNQIGGDGIERSLGMIITHCHDDHKRWFTDLALYLMYASKADKKLFLITAEEIIDELKTASGPAMNRSLSFDSSRIVDIPFEQHTEARILGPKAIYRIAPIANGDSWTYRVVDRSGTPLAPDKAKVVVNPATGRPRMLFKDPEYKEWVEPESFYSFNSEVFYEKQQNHYEDNGFRIEAIKAPIWHGIPGIGLRFSTDTESLMFTSDTVHDTKLWKKLYTTKLRQELGQSPEEFGKSPLIFGDINNYIERTWGEQRYKDAINSFGNSIVMQDVSYEGSVVHTDYSMLKNTNLDKNRTILTHSPDTMTSEWAFSSSGKSYVVTGGEVFELVGDKKHRLDADIYHKEDGKYFVGYKRENGPYMAIQKNDILSVIPFGSPIPEGSSEMFRIELFQDIHGRYFPRLNGNGSSYLMRDDSNVELIEFSDKGSSGSLVKDLRGTLKQ